MKRILRRILPLLLAALFLLASCASRDEMRYEDGKYTLKSNGVTYLRAPLCYQAVSYEEEEEVAKIVLKGMPEEILYAVEGVDPQKMLSNAAHELLYAEDLQLPTLFEMDPEKVYVTQTVELSWTVAQITEASVLAELLRVLGEDKSFPMREIDATLSKEFYDLKFSSEAHPGIYYCVSYWQFEEDVLIYEEIETEVGFPITYPNVPVTTEEYKGSLYAVYNFGKGLLYDREAKACYAVDDLIWQYISDAE